MQEVCRRLEAKSGFNQLLQIAMDRLGTVTALAIGATAGWLFYRRRYLDPQYHICAWKLKNTADVEAIRVELATWKYRIPGILDLVFDDIHQYEPTPGLLAAYAGANAHEMLGYTHFLIVTFDSVRSRLRYSDHPVHLEFSKLMMPSLVEDSESVISFDSTPRGV